MEAVIAAIVTGILALLAGTFGSYYVNQLMQARQHSLSTMRDQLANVWGPLEILAKTNHREFLRFIKPATADSDKEFIEKNVWYPNNNEIHRILMESSHLLPEIPEEFLQLLTHINAWLTQYDLVYNKGTSTPPVFAHGNAWPEGVDDYIYKRAGELRRRLNRNQISEEEEQTQTTS